MMSSADVGLNISKPHIVQKTKECQGCLCLQLVLSFRYSSAYNRNPPFSGKIA